MVAADLPPRLGRHRSARRASLWSRSRRELWEKGATSGNTLHVREIKLDCDSDAVLLLVDPDGPACHTGATSCFFADVTIDKTSG